MDGGAAEKDMSRASLPRPPVHSGATALGGHDADAAFGPLHQIGHRVPRVPASRTGVAPPGLEVL